jgi:peptidoglycan hydrolase-like protein with peptidoglycan-binding domain
METLAYLHLALADEGSADPDYTLSISWENPKLLSWLYQQKLPSSATIHLLSLSVALGVIGMAQQASALVKHGSQGSEVSALQERLLELGYFKGNATGYFGPVTEDAVRQFQQAKGLTPDGIVGTNTSNALSGQSQESKQTESLSSSDILRLGDRGEKVSALQKQLEVAGFSGGEQGNFDQATQEAVQRFQQAKGLTVDGIAGQQTIAALPTSDTSVSTPIETEPTPAATEPTPAVTESTPTATPTPKKPTSFFDSQEGSLSPFIRKP